MCGRYSITITLKRLCELLKLEPPAEDIPPRYNAAPSQLLPLINNDEPHKLNLFRWGLVPFWAKDLKISAKLINARMETITEKASFKHAFKKRRCLVLADSYYEWQNTAAGKVPYRIMLENGEPFAFAGIWEKWVNKEDHSEIKSFSIITCDASPELKEIHHRMPVLIRPENYQAWLDPKLEQEAALSLLQNHPEDGFKYYPISTMVNSPHNDSPEIIKPLNN